MKHDIFFDRAGWGRRSRITCLTCDKTCLRQPYMSYQKWLDEVIKFSKSHPSPQLDKRISEMEKTVGEFF